jgi:transcriptional regulator with XRE-family HTH domain
MSNSFADFMREMEEEAHQAGPAVQAAFFESQQRHWIGRRLFERRRELGYTQAKLSALSGINQSDISKIEHAEANPTLDTLATLATALELTLALEPISEAVRTLTARPCPPHIADRVIGLAGECLRRPSPAASRAAAATRPTKVGAGSSTRRSAPSSRAATPAKRSGRAS